LTDVSSTYVRASLIIDFGTSFSHFTRCSFFFFYCIVSESRSTNCDDLKYMRNAGESYTNTTCKIFPFEPRCHSKSKSVFPSVK
jgi:hypothetical protein